MKIQEKKFNRINKIIKIQKITYFLKKLLKNRLIETIFY